MDRLTISVQRAMIKAAHKAVIPLYQRLNACDVREKDPGETVTAADELAEAILTAELSRLLPEALVVGEEAAAKDPSTLTRLGSSQCWIIDPLDGTSNFASGRGPFGIMVALAEAGEVVGGWILDPMSGRFCHATRGGGAWVDGQRIAPRDIAAPKPRVAVSTLFGDGKRRSQIAEQLAGRYEVMPMPRCAADQYPAVALGASDIALYGRTLPWDHAAGVMLIGEAGGRAARLDGSPYRVDDPQPNLIVAGSPRLWDEFATELAKLPECVG